MSAKNIVMGAAGASTPLYVEDVFSTYLYTGNSPGQDITNGIDLAGKGGMVWIKGRSGATDHKLIDTVRGATNALTSTTNAGQTIETTGLTAFTSTGFSLSNSSVYNTNASTYASWSFRKQAKFFDIVTWTGDGTGGSGRRLPHNLGCDVGLVMIKATNSGGDWMVSARKSNGNFAQGYPPGGNIFGLNTTLPAGPYEGSYASVASATTLYLTQGMGVNESIPHTNSNGTTYVAYLFAHDPSPEGIIQCGSFTSTGGGATPVDITLGWEPQYILLKNISSTSGNTNWMLYDSMRDGLKGGSPVSGQKRLYANTADIEANNTGYFVNTTATGFQQVPNNMSAAEYTYMAIRRGPMKVPTDGTKVFNAIARTGTGAAATVAGVGFSPDMVMFQQRNGANNGNLAYDRLRGANKSLFSSNTGAELADTDALMSYDMDGVTLGANAASNRTNWNTFTYINYFFKRAPSVFDVVCYTGDGTTNRSISHNLGVIPELYITRARSGLSVYAWGVYSYATGLTKVLQLGTTDAATTDNWWGANSLTTSSFSVSGNDVAANNSTGTYVAYLFASCPGVSKVGNYTGNGTTQAIACGFSAGARFILIKRTDSTGDWYTWDTARGIVAGNDPHLSLNTTAAEVTTDDSIDPDASGFIVNQNPATNINVTSATYIFLAIA